MSGRLCSTTRAPPDYLPAPALLPLDTDKETLLSSAVAQNLTAPLALSCLHPSYHPPLPLPEEIQLSQLFKLHRFVHKTGFAGPSAKAAAAADKAVGRNGGQGHRVGARPPLSELWDRFEMSSEKEGGRTGNDGGGGGRTEVAAATSSAAHGGEDDRERGSNKRLCVIPRRRPDFLVDWLSGSSNRSDIGGDDTSAWTSQPRHSTNVWLREEVKHGRRKVRILWDDCLVSEGHNSTSPTGWKTSSSHPSSNNVVGSSADTNGNRGVVVLNPPRMEVVSLKNDEEGESVVYEHEIVLYSNHGGGAVVVYSLYDSEHIICCSDDSMEGEEDGNILLHDEEHSNGSVCEFYHTEPTMLSSRGWFIYDDRNRPRVKLGDDSCGAISLCAYLHLPGRGWADSPFLREVIRKPTERGGEDEGVVTTRDDTAAKTKWSYSLFMETGRNEEDGGESEGSENGDGEHDSRGEQDDTQ
eukprot:GHVS01035057.1.p1 GENE.GHVS01035057.1~~GHVS01035057.1.p1  ORF type:complete len:533 (+),score=114.86 GHVS01035057.1:197-1600(+)